MQLSIHDDGTFDLVLRDCALRGVRPAIDFEPIMPVRTDIDHTTGHERIRYQLSGQVTLQLAFSRVGGAMAIATSLQGMACAPHWVHPLANARLEGFERLYRTGIGFSGPTNIVPLPSMSDNAPPASYPPDGRTSTATPQQPYSFESYLFAGLISQSGLTLCISTRDVRDYLFKCHVENRLHRHQFRNREVARNAVYAQCGFATERIPLAHGALDLPAIVLDAHQDAFTGMRSAAIETARASSARVGAPSYHYCSFYRHGEHFTRRDLEDVLVSLRRDPEPLRCVQIDGGFSAHYGDWLEPHSQRFPDGLEEAFTAIKRAGHVPGIWVGPFMISNRSRIAREHPAWLLHWNDGSRVTEWRHYMGATSSADEEVYVLDTSHPDALAYITACFATLYRWGARFFKTDFLEWGWKDSTRVRRFAPGKTSTQYFTDVLRAVRGAIGEDSYWLGCITYFAPCIGFMDCMRVSSDVGIAWNDAPGGIGNDGCGGGTQNAVEEIYGCQFFNNILWQNDPDVTFFRDRYIGLREHEVQALAMWNGILGVSMNTSDLDGLPASRRSWWRFMRPQQECWTARLPYLTTGSRLKVAVREYPQLQAWAVVILNDGQQPVQEQCVIADWIGLGSAHLFQWDPTGATELGVHTHWFVHLAGHHAQLLYLSAAGAPPPADLTLGGWRPHQQEPLRSTSLATAVG